MKYDVIVVGGGHAGSEAAHAAATMGLKTLLCTLNIKMISNMPCNPSIGGSAKGIVVREVDALGGLMGIAADKNYLQIKMLNTGKGPGVQCLRAQEDKLDYPHQMQILLSNTPNLEIRECMVTSLITENRIIKGVVINEKEIVDTIAVVLTTGTYMESEVSHGLDKVSGGPDGQKPSHGLSKSLLDLGVDLYRLKTGTPPRISKKSIDFSKGTIQEGSDGKYAFSYTTTRFIPLKEQLPCYLIYTTPETLNIIRNNLDSSAQFNGLIKSIGPRYCPSIEGKVMTFKDKERHQLFLEPETRDGDSIYLQGFATSMATNIQEKMVHSLPGLEHAVILKYAYAIEYDAVRTYEYDSTLAIKKINGLYVGGQICGTSGYEEAAGLGLVAGINASLYVKKLPPFILKRNESYIGVMIDDLITKGTAEPYRLMSSRAEYRLLLRHDNADIRLTPYGYNLGLISEDRYKGFVDKQRNIDLCCKYLQSKNIGSNKIVNDVIKIKGYDPLSCGISLYDLLKRPGIDFQDLLKIDSTITNYHLDDTAIFQLETMIKYEGYIKKEEKEAKSFLKLEKIMLNKDIDYLHFDGLALEARQKLNKVKPLTLGQASRISGVNPSDISILIMSLKKKGAL